MRTEFLRLAFLQDDELKRRGNGLHHSACLVVGTKRAHQDSSSITPENHDSGINVGVMAEHDITISHWRKWKDLEFLILLDL